jgi:hypothetical protein
MPGKSNVSGLTQKPFVQQLLAAFFAAAQQPVQLLAKLTPEKFWESLKFLQGTTSNK